MKEIKQLDKLGKDLNVVYVPVTELKFSEYNPRLWPEKTIKDLKKSIQMNGFIIPLLANSAKERKNVLISGHFRLKIAKDLGFTELPVTYVNVPDINKEKELNLTINRVSGEWDFELLKGFEIEMLLDSGFDNFDLSQIFDDNLDVDDDNFKVDEEIEKIKTPKTKLGDLIILGNHRLICSDSQDSKVVARLVEDRKINMLNFDPIYNIDLDYNNGFGKRGKYGGKVKDKKSDEDYKQFLKTIFQNGLAHTLPDTHVFCWCDETYIGLIQSLYTELGITNRRVCLWIKNSQNPTPQVAFNKACELCAYGTVGSPFLSPSVKNLNEVMNKEVSSGNRLSDDIMDLFNIWLVKRLSGQEYEHPTEKPPQLYEKALRRCSKPGDIILDLFAGSGSLMSAAEQIKRRVFMSEIDPIFCDLIVKRYELLSGKEAIYVNSEK
jgi:DNA modification methylase